MHTPPAHMLATRLRRTRMHATWRDLLAQNHLSAQHLIAPVFVCDGEQRQEAIASLNTYRYSIENAIAHIRHLRGVGIGMVALFPYIEPALKDANGTQGVAKDMLMCRAIRAIKEAVPDMMLIADVALDPYTNHGHDGILDASGTSIDNTDTVLTLVEQARLLAHAGADAVAPSDMCDGRVGAIRAMLEQESLNNTLIISYTAKYASCFYGPFRDAVGSAGALTGDKRTYQMDFRNHTEALREAEQDVAEGADMLLVKPGLPYLDVVYSIAQRTHVPVLAYQVSGEYAMLRAGAATGAFDYLTALYESLMAFRRAGARGIFTYGAYDMALALQQGHFAA